MADGMNPTNWHYVLSGEKRGPVTEAELSRLVAAGTVTATTMVWSEGMTAWAPYGDVRLVRPELPPIPGSSAEALPTGAVQCGQCRQLVAAGDAVSLGGSWVCAACKPQALQKLREGMSTNPEAEMIRKTHIWHESSIRALGGLYLLCGVLFFWVFLKFIVGFSTISAQWVLLGLIMAAAFMGIALLFLGSGIGLLRLRKPARTGATALAVLGLLGFPVGTLMSVGILWLLFSPKSKRVFADDYPQIIAETPHIRHRTPVWAWIALGLFLFAIVAWFVFVAMLQAWARSWMPVLESSPP